jgi:hypothetical protein
LVPLLLHVITPPPAPLPTYNFFVGRDIKGRFVLYTPNQILFVDQIKKTEMGRVCTTYGKQMLTGCRWGNLRERDHLKDPGVDGRIIVKWIFQEWDGRMDWIDLA